MSLRNFKDTSARWNCFAKVDQLGAFDFYTAIISLDALRPHDVVGFTIADLQCESEELLTMAQYETCKKALPLAVHEFTHYLDSTATLWGMEHLCRIDDGHIASKGTEPGFYKLKSLFDHVRRLRLPNYYTTVDRGVAATRPWAMHLTGGREYSSEGRLSERPILFGRFLNSEGKSLARSPISILSLLETSAMAAELEVGSSLVNRLGEEKIVEEKLFTTAILEHIYNPIFTEYSVCAHLVANRLKMSDILVAYKMSAVIARVVLNAPRVSFDKARANIGQFAAEYGLDKNSNEASLIRHGLKQYNHGALFYLLVMLLPQNSGTSWKSFISGVNSSFAALGMNLREVLESSAREVRKCAAQLETSDLISLRSIGASALKNYEILKNLPISLPFKDLHLPPVLLNDMSQHQFADVQSNMLARFDLEAAYDELVDIQIRAENFSEACL